MQLDLSKELSQLKKFKEREKKLKLSGIISPHSKEESKSNKKFKVLYGRPKRTLRLGSLFSGIGGFEQALKLLRIKYETAFVCDNDKFVKKAYFANHGDKINPKNWFDDIEDFNDDSVYDFLGKVDLLVGGPPCQSFSIIGKHGGLKDARGNLVFDYIDTIKKVNPRIFIFENVKGLLMIQDGHIWSTVKKEFEKLGYKLFWKCLNAKNYGIPQNRERLFVIGFRNQSINYKWPKPWPCTKVMQDFLENDVRKKYHLPKKGIDFVLKQNNLKKRYTNINETIQSTQKANQQFNWHGDFVTVPHNIYLDRYTLSDKVQNFVMEKGSKTFNAKPGTDLSTARTILSTCHKMHRAGVDNYIKRKNRPNKIRRLTPRECLNLMGWVDKNYMPIEFNTEYDGKIISDTQLYRQAGNSVVVWVVAQIISCLRFDQLNI